VANDGFDVPPSEVDRLFEPFKRLDADRTDHGDGWGLSLAIVRAVSEAHGATVVAHSGVAGGLEIGVVFPAPKDQAG
jgi:signal transduction histidine kinase